MVTRPDPLSPAAFGIDAVGVLTRRVSPGQSLIREVKVSLARVRFGEDVAARSDPPPKKPAPRSPVSSAAPTSEDATNPSEFYGADEVRDMPVHLVVAVTDQDWFEHLRRLPDLSEVNFWSPSPRPFQALTPGELFPVQAPRCDQQDRRRWRFCLREYDARAAGVGSVWHGERCSEPHRDALPHHALSPV